MGRSANKSKKIVGQFVHQSRQSNNFRLLLIVCISNFPMSEERNDRCEPDSCQEKKEIIKSVIPSFNCLIVGDIGVGKTTFCTRFEPTGEALESKYATLHPIVFDTTHGKIQFVLWDPNGLESTSPLPDEFYKYATCAILMFSVGDRSTYKNIPNWYRETVRVCEFIPTVLVGTKIDDGNNRKIKPKMITFNRKKNLKYCEVSSLANFRVEVPFLLLSQLLTRDDSLRIVERPHISHPTVIVDMDYQKGIDVEHELLLMPEPRGRLLEIKRFHL
jgi:GTP-binding nuclear protein Ran